MLVGVKKPVLPLNLVGDRVNYDNALTNAATLAEVDAMRAGRAFTVARRVDLNFTTPCCEGLNPGRVASGYGPRTSTATSPRTISFKAPRLTNQNHAGVEPR